MALQIIVDEVKRLGQEEGLNDTEIAKELGCSRATVNRVRYKYKIPTANLSNKKDKEYVCNVCKKTITIRRKERRKLLCPACEEIKAINKTVNGVEVLEGIEVKKDV